MGAAGWGSRLWGLCEARSPLWGCPKLSVNEALQEWLQGFYGFSLKILFPEKTKAINPNYRAVICNNICFKYMYF